MGGGKDEGPRGTNERAGGSERKRQKMTGWEEIGERRRRRTRTPEMPKKQTKGEVGAGTHASHKNMKFEINLPIFHYKTIKFRGARPEAAPREPRSTPVGGSSGARPEAASSPPGGGSHIFDVLVHNFLSFSNVLQTIRRGS